MYRNMPRKRFLLALALAATLGAGCATRRPGDPIRPGFNLYTPDQDIELGREAAAQIRSQVEIVSDRELQSYVAQIGQRLAAQPEAGTYPYSFTMINEKEINAFALPGGPIFVNAGTLEAADNEAQFAGVLAHEIGHVALRHATNQASKANLIQIPAVLGGAAIGQGSVGAQLAQLGLGFGVNSLLLRYSRDAETEADALGARIMAQAGYNPIEMARFFDKLEAQEGARAPQFLASHPDPGNRMQAVQAEIQTLPQRQYVADSGQFPHMKQEVAQLRPPRRTVQQAQTAALPSNVTEGFRRLETDAVSLGYPGNWQAFGDRRSAVITIAPRQGLVRNQNGRVSLGYGAVLSYHQPQTGRSNLEQATQELISQLGSVNPNLRAENRQQVSVDGNAGLLTTLSGISPYGGSETDFLLTVARPEGLFYIVFVVPQTYATRAEETFDQMLRSIQFRE